MEFCHIAPTAYLDLVQGRPFHLTLAHLVETDDKYVNFYLDQRQAHNPYVILDNSAFEMYKQGRPMYPSDKLIEMGNKIRANCIVMSDYPGEKSDKTIEAAQMMAPELHMEGFETFFVPQSAPGDELDAIAAFQWAANHPELVDYIGVSILTAPNAYGVEKGNKMQRFVSRLKLMYTLRDEGILDQIRDNGIKIHLLGMVDGPNEVMYMEPFRQYINTWDSSAAIWAGLNNIQFDNTPTGLRDGKYEEEVDFDMKYNSKVPVDLAQANMYTIDTMCKAYLDYVEID